MAQIPSPQPGAIESWLLSAAAILAIVYLAKKLFIRKPSVEAEFSTKGEVLALKNENEARFKRIEDRLDQRFELISTKLDENRAAIITSFERARAGLHSRINQVEQSVARLDERTHK